MKKSLGVFMAMALMADQAEMQESTKRIRKPKSRNIPKGLKEFIYGTESVFAINQKNADRKARKKGLIN